jgi:hypothetical protein
VGEFGTFPAGGSSSGGSCAGKWHSSATRLVGISDGHWTALILTEAISGSADGWEGKSTSSLLGGIKCVVPVAVGTERSVGVAAWGGVIGFLIICGSRDFEQRNRNQALH